MKLFKLVFNYLKIIFNNQKNTKNVKEIVDNSFFNKLKKAGFGTVIFASRGCSVDNILDLPEGHRNGPFIVLENNGSKLVCCYGTSKIITNNENDFKYIKFLESEYSLKKDTYFSLPKVFEIDYNDVLKIFGELNVEDKNILLRKLNILINRSFYKELVPNVSKPILNVGDICRIGLDHYLVIGTDEDNYICLPLSISKEIDKSRNINTNHRYYNVNYKEIKINKNNSDILIFNTLSNAKLLSVLKYYKEYKENRNNKQTIQRGSILKINSEYFYIYGENGDKWLLFSISRESLNNSFNFKINNKCYYSNFDKYEEINKKYNAYEIVDLALSIEMDNISAIRKSVKKERKNINNSSLQSEYKTFLPGEVIETKTMSDDKYVIIKRNKVGVYCISFDEWNKNNPTPHYFDIKFIKKSSVKLDMPNEMIFEKVLKLTKSKTRIV